MDHAGRLWQIAHNIVIVAITASDSVVTQNLISAHLALCTCYDSDSNNCSRYYISDFKFPKLYSVSSSTLLTLIYS